MEYNACLANGSAQWYGIHTFQLDFSLSLSFTRSIARSLLIWLFGVFHYIFMWHHIKNDSKRTYAECVRRCVCVYVCIEYDKGISCEWTMHVKYAWELNQFFGGNGAFCARRARLLHIMNTLLLLKHGGGGSLIQNCW